VIKLKLSLETLPGTFSSRPKTSHLPVGGFRMMQHTFNGCAKLVNM